MQWYATIFVIVSAPCEIQSTDLMIAGHQLDIAVAKMSIKVATFLLFDSTVEATILKRCEWSQWRAWVVWLVGPLDLPLTYKLSPQCTCRSTAIN